MKKELFKPLIEDLYSIYNPNHLQYADFITEKYHLMPSEAVKIAFTKYNSVNSPYYDPQKNTEEYINNLIAEYDKGNRTLQKIDLLNEKQKSLEKSKKEEEEKQSEKGKENEALKKEIEELKKGLVNDYIIDIQSNIDPSFILPDNRIIASLGIGSRIVASDKDGKIIGLIIKDVLFDNTTIEFMGKPSLMIVIEKA